MQVGDRVRYRSQCLHMKDYEGRIVKLLATRVAVKVETGALAGTIRTVSRDSLFILARAVKPVRAGAGGVRA